MEKPSQEKCAEYLEQILKLAGPPFDNTTYAPHVRVNMLRQAKEKADKKIAKLEKDLAWARKWMHSYHASSED